MILPVMTCPGLDLVEEIVVFKRTGKMVPLGMVIAPSFALAGWATSVAQSTVDSTKSRQTAFPKL